MVESDILFFSLAVTRYQLSTTLGPESERPSYDELVWNHSRSYAFISAALSFTAFRYRASGLYIRCAHLPNGTSTTSMGTAMARCTT